VIYQSIDKNSQISKNMLW